jgi:hypothetical protein
MQNSPEARLANPFQNLLVGKPPHSICKCINFFQISNIMTIGGANLALSSSWDIHYWPETESRANMGWGQYHVEMPMY